MPLVDLKTALHGAAPLDPARAISSPCKICGRRSREFDLVDANKIASATTPFQFGLAGYGVRLLRCDHCDFIFTTEYDDWSGADFARLIYNDDYIKVDPEYVSARPKRLAATIGQRLDKYRDIRLLDYGSGAGVFENELRAQGINRVASYDPFSNPVRPSGSFDVITCFEVVEHSPAPVTLFRDIVSLLAPNGVIVLGTALQPANINQIRGSWWYIAPRNGHLSFFSIATLSQLGRELNLVFARGRHQQSLFFRPDSPPADAFLDALGGGNVTRQERIHLYSPDPTIVRRGPVQPLTPDSGWYPAETNALGRRYRWSRQDTLEWRVQTAGPTHLQLLCEPLMAIQPGHLEHLRIMVDDQEVPVVRTGRRFTAQVDVGEAKELRVSVRTPPPISPTSLGRTDKRELGIALPAED